jgi:calcineurin-like phosphoesterase family protein
MQETQKKLYITADLHISNEKLLNIACRPFSSIQAWRQHLIANINKYVSEDSILIINGDIQAESREDWLEFRNALNCQEIWMILGNHDGSDMYRDTVAVLDSKLIITYETNDRDYVIHIDHYPQAFWFRSHYGSLHMYGHCHAQREAFLNKALPGRRSQDIGVDMAYIIYGEYRPFDLDILCSELQMRPGHHDLAVEREWEAEHKHRMDNLIA